MNENGLVGDLVWDRSALTSMMVPISAPIADGHVAVLEYGGVLPAQDARCLTFDYSVGYKSNRGRLSAYLVEIPTGNRILVWQRAGGSQPEFNSVTYTKAQVAISAKTIWTVSESKSETASSLMPRLVDCSLNSLIDSLTCSFIGSNSSRLLRY